MKRWPLLALLSCAVAPVAAQQRWLDANPGHAAEVALALAAFDDNITDSPAITIAVRGRLALRDNLAITAELPGARAEQQAGLSGTAVGNPWVGLQYTPAQGMQLELGARLNLWPPTTQRRSLPFGYGQLVDFDRREAWFANASAVRAVAHVGRLPSRGRFVTVKAGLAGFAVSGGGGDGELLAHYGGRAGVVSGRWVTWIGVIGQGIVTESDLSIADRTIHQAELAVATHVQGWHVELGLRRFVAEWFGSSVPIIVQFTVRAAP